MYEGCFETKITINDIEDKIIIKVYSYGSYATEDLDGTFEFKDNKEALNFFNSLSLKIRAAIKAH
jgi:hypothetical protein